MLNKLINIFLNIQYVYTIVRSSFTFYTNVIYDETKIYQVEKKSLKKT